MDLINKAKDWTQVDEQLTHEVPGHLTRETRKIPSNGMLTLKVNHYKHRVFLLSLGQFLIFFLFFSRLEVLQICLNFFSLGFSPF